jgi:quercetin dioxygenase-like cupin family protein
MKKLFLLSCLFINFICFAQHAHESKTATKEWSHIPVFTQSFTDSSFAGKEVQLVNFTIPAGAIDSIAHQHNCHLIGYILEGQVITKLKDKPAQHLKKGNVFYEFPNEIHESIQNPDKKKEAIILLYYLFDKGASLYKKRG